jgi:hypothetical protein
MRPAKLSACNVSLSATNTATYLSNTDSNTLCYCVMMRAPVRHEANKLRDLAERFLNILAEKRNFILPEYNVVLTD